MKIFHGMREVAGQAYYSVKGLRENGMDAQLILRDKSPMAYPYDRCLHIDRNEKCKLPLFLWKIFVNFIQCSREYEVFHFHSGYTLLPKNLDLPRLKRKKKRIVLEFHGSDIRDEQIFKEKNQFAERLTLPFNSEQREYLGKIINRYADEIIIHDDELLAHIPGNKMDRVHIVPLRMDLDKFQPVEASSEGESVVIAHAPSNRKIKGTIYIEQAVENLAKKYDLEFVLVENMTQEQAIEQYRRADIVIDQMLIGTYGVFAIETMALGKPVITYLTEEMQASLPESLPIVSGNPDTVEQVLEALIQDKERRVQLGKAGRAYVETYHDCNKNAKLLMKIYQGKHQPKVGREAFEEVVEK